MATNTLGRYERLKSRKLITELFKSGKSFNAFPFRVVYLLWSDAPDNNLKAKPLGQKRPLVNALKTPLQAGFSVSTRNFKRAADRNRVKRLMRESYRIQKMALTQILQKKGKTLAFFLIFTGKEVPEHDFVETKVNAVVEKITKIIDEVPA